MSRSMDTCPEFQILMTLVRQRRPSQSLRSSFRQNVARRWCTAQELDNQRIVRVAAIVYAAITAPMLRMVAMRTRRKTRI